MKSLFKPLITLTVIASLVFGVAACTNNSDDTNEGLTSDQTIAYSTYMAGAFLSGETANNTTGTNHASVAYLETNSDSLAMLSIEEELGEVNRYFNRLKVFLDNGMENPFEINRDLDVDGDYDITMGYTVEDMDYTILLNEDDEGNLTGTLTLDGVDYEVEGSREVETETESDDDGEGTTTESEQEIYLKTIDIENSDNFIEIAIETEDDDEEYEFEMEMTSVIDDIETVLYIEFEIEGDEVSIEMETENGNSYSFSRSTENNAEDIDYEFEYTVDGVEGEVELKISINDNGNKEYHYTIEEAGEEKEFTLDENGQNISDNNTDEEDEPTT